MSIIFNDNILGVWYVTIPNGDYLAAVSRCKDGGAFLQYRFRYYNSEEPWDEKDEKHWYEARSKDQTKVVAHASFVAKTLANASKGKIWELIRGAGSLEDFMAEFQKLPFVHSRPATAEEIKKIESSKE